MSSLLARLKKGNRNTKRVDYPGTESPVLLRVLSEQEQQDAMIAAELYLKDKKIEISMGSVDVYAAEQSVQILYRALRDPENPERPFAESPDEMRKLNSSGELNVLNDQYREYELECSPDPMEMTQSDFDSLVADVKKNCEGSLSRVSNIVIAKKLIVSLVSQPTK